MIFGLVQYLQPFFLLIASSELGMTLTNISIRAITFDDISDFHENQI